MQKTKSVYPTGDQLLEIWTAYEQNGQAGIKGVLDKWDQEKKSARESTTADKYKE